MRKICERCCSIKALTVIAAALVVVFAGILVLSFVGIPLLIDKIVANTLKLKENTDQWDRFLELPIPLIDKIYLFNVTNADDILKGQIPIVEEVGPYVYKQKLTRSVLETDNGDDSVTYHKYLTPTFDQELSGNLTENDTVVVLNPALLVLTQVTTTVEQMVVMGCMDKIFPPEYNKLFITSHVRTLMFEGFFFANITEDVGYACNIVRKQVIEKTKKMKNIQWIMNEDFPEMVQMLKFSYMGYKIQKPDGIYSVNRGIKDISKLGTVMRWNNSTETSYYGRLGSTNNETCHRVRGGDSTIYPPKVTKDSSIEIFSTDICRTVKIYYAGEDTYKGIKGYRFEPITTTFYPALPNVEQDCYCTKMTLNPKGESSCYLDGIIDVYDCFGAPLLLTFPHFLYADKKYLNAVNGISPPDKSIHGIYLLIEPNTGVPLQGMKRVQLNVVLRPIKHMPFAAQLPETILPLLWLDEVSVSDNIPFSKTDRSLIELDILEVYEIKKHLKYPQYTVLNEQLNLGSSIILDHLLKQIILPNILLNNDWLPEIPKPRKTIIHITTLWKTVEIQGAELSDDLVDMLNTKFFNSIKLANGFKYGLIALSAASVLVVSGILFRKKFLKW